jgi:hypothetical protein
MGKTVQAMKVSATWTPEYAKAAFMAEAAFRNTDGDGLRFEGGRIGVKLAIVIDMADPAHVVRVSERIAKVKAHLEATGKLHSFITSMGAVPVEDFIILTEEPATQAEAA